MTTAFLLVLALLLGGLVSCGPAQSPPATAEELLATPGEWACLDGEQRPIRVIKGVTPDYALSHYCQADVCGGASWACDPLPPRLLD